mmetsp:Transcript_114861/g.198951  ORF Transcript_114861/g.198951 Transcript_114861/m.198951 type:complete len:239 (+) Transcript_114861:65-781(+)
MSAEELSGQCGQRVLFRAQFRKTRLCRFFEIGQCSKGQACPFAHGSTEMQTAPDLTKTSICRAWRQKQCPFSAMRCPFAHGASELRKTDLYAESNNWKLLKGHDEEFGVVPELSPARKSSDEGVFDELLNWPRRNNTANNMGCEMLIQPTSNNAQGVVLAEQDLMDLKRGMEVQQARMFYATQSPTKGGQQALASSPWPSSQYDKATALSQFMLALNTLPAEKLEPLLAQAMPECYED